MLTSMQLLEKQNKLSWRIGKPDITLRIQTPELEWFSDLQVRIELTTLRVLVWTLLPKIS